MAEVDGFKHISVATDDDDVVIRAGVVAQVPETAQDAVADAAHDAVAAAKPPAREAVSAPRANAEQTPSHSVGEAAAKPQSAPTKSRKKADDGYRETTLDDLKSEPMPKTQKTVITCALVVLVAAAIYYFCFMR